MDSKNLLYHYSKVKVEDIHSLRSQINNGIRVFSKDYVKLLDERDSYNESILPYTEHISFLLDPLPLDLILQHFPKDRSPYLKGSNYLYEHVVDVSKFKLNGWELLDSPLERKIWNWSLMDYLLDEEDAPTKQYLQIVKATRYIQGLTGSDTDKLLKVLEKYKGQTRDRFLDWINSDSFENESHTYSSNIPHIRLFPTDGYVTPIKINKLSLNMNKHTRVGRTNNTYLTNVSVYTEENTDTTLAVEAIDLQVNSKLAKGLYDKFYALRGHPNLNQTHVDQQNFSKLIMDETGLDIGMTIGGGAEACIYTPWINQGNPMSNNDDRAWVRKLKDKLMGNVDADRLFEKRNFIDGTVDLKHSRVSGDFSTVRMEIIIGNTFVYKYSKLSVEEIVAIVLHEIGHAFVYMEMLARFTRTNYVMIEGVNRLLTANTKEQRLILLKQIEDSYGVPIDNIDEYSEKKRTEDSYRATIIYLATKESIKELDVNVYDARSYEQLADQFSTRHGYGKHLATGLVKIHMDFVSQFTLPPVLYFFFQLVKFLMFIGLIFYLVTAPVHLAVRVVPYIFTRLVGVILAGSPLRDTYDPLPLRIDKIKQQFNEQLKNTKLPVKDRQELLSSIDAINGLLTEVYNNRDWYTLVYTYIIPAGITSTRLITVQQKMELMYNNPLFEAAARLSKEGYGNAELSEYDKDYSEFNDNITKLEIHLEQYGNVLNKRNKLMELLPYIEKNGIDSKVVYTVNSIEGYEVMGVECYTTNSTVNVEGFLDVVKSVGKSIITSKLGIIALILLVIGFLMKWIFGKAKAKSVNEYNGFVAECDKVSKMYDASAAARKKYVHPTEEELKAKVQKTVDDILKRRGYVPPTPKPKPTAKPIVDEAEDAEFTEIPIVADPKITIDKLLPNAAYSAQVTKSVDNTVSILKGIFGDRVDSLLNILPNGVFEKIDVIILDMVKFTSECNAGSLAIYGILNNIQKEINANIHSTKGNVTEDQIKLIKVKVNSILPIVEKDLDILASAYSMEDLKKHIPITTDYKHQPFDKSKFIPNNTNGVFWQVKSGVRISLLSNILSDRVKITPVTIVKLMDYNTYNNLPNLQKVINNPSYEELLNSFSRRLEGYRSSLERYDRDICNLWKEIEHDCDKVAYSYASTSTNTVVNITYGKIAMKISNSSLMNSYDNSFELFASILKGASTSTAIAYSTNVKLKDINDSAREMSKATVKAYNSYYKSQGIEISNDIIEHINSEMCRVLKIYIPYNLVDDNTASLIYNRHTLSIFRQNLSIDIYDDDFDNGVDLNKLKLK